MEELTGRPQGQAIPQDSPGSWAEVLAGMVPFLLYPLLFLVVGPAMEALLAYLDPPDSIWPAASSIWALILVSPFLGALVVSWVSGFPRWCFPYWGLALLFSAFLTGTATPDLWVFGQGIGRGDLWGWRAFVPLLVVGAVATLVRRSLLPLEQLVSGVQRDWTRIAFAVYGTLPWMLMVAFDSVQGETIPLSLLSGVLAVGALMYVRSRQIWQRMLALLVTLTVVWIAAAAYLQWYWQRH